MLPKRTSHHTPRHIVTSLRQKVKENTPDRKNFNIFSKFFYRPKYVDRFGVDLFVYKGLQLNRYTYYFQTLCRYCGYAKKNYLDFSQREYIFSYMKQTKTKRKKNKTMSCFSSKPLSMPDKFCPGFLQTLDKRSIVFQGVRKSFLQTCDDLGGKDSLSHAKLVLVERFCFGEYLIQNLEVAILAKPTDELVTKWISVTKALSALAVRIGLQREARSVLNVAVRAIFSYLN